MKARTYNGNGFVYFAYEDYDGIKYGNYTQAKKQGRKPIYLVGFFHSFYFNSSEPIDKLKLESKPKIGQVKRFMTGCMKTMDMLRD